MSQRPFGYGTRNTLRDIDERAAPRTSGFGEKRHHHPVIPISSTAAPHYAQVSQLYPMRTSTERDNVYRYRPGSGSLGSTSPTNLGQPVSIPVVHLGQPRSVVTSPTGSNSFTSSYASVGGAEQIGAQAADTVDTSYRSPSYRTSVTTSAGRVGSRTPVTNDPEAEVDELAKELMRSMATRSSSTSGLGGSPGSAHGMDGSTSSPAGSIRRGSGSTTPISSSSQMGRLQQHLGMSSSPVGIGGLNTNGGRGSPLTTGATVSTTGGSATNSPTGSTSSVHTTTDVGGTVATSTFGQTSCFRCSRALVPPPGTTLNSNSNTTNNNMVTLTGALAVRLHVACFTCYRCAAPLRPDAYYHSLRRLLCPACVRDGAVETCSNCSRPIGDRFVHALGLSYHLNCFVCVGCSCRLDSKPFTIDVHGRLHCLDDFHRRYAPRCASCGKPITPEHGIQEARRVVSGDSNYHLECFRIQTMNQSSTLTTSKLSTGVVS